MPTRNGELLREAFRLKNVSKRPLQIICEPSCSEYRLKPKSEIVLKAETRVPRDEIPPIIAELDDDYLTIWVEDALGDPDAEIDGKPTRPFHWRDDDGGGQNGRR